MNTTGVAEVDATLSSDCQVFTADRQAMADFLWTVDVSLSMNRYQQQIGNTAQSFFRDLDTAGVDFRVAVLAAHRTFDFAVPGLPWVASTSATGATELAYRVTVDQFATMAADTLWPYSNNGMLELNTGEEPIAAAIVVYEQLHAGSMSGAPANQRLCDGAQTIAFFVADETGNNDDSRYFAPNRARWGATDPARLAAAINFYQTNHIMAFGLVNFTTAPSCDPTVPQDMRRCVILGSGGAWIPIGTATDADVSAAMARIVAAVAGATSQFHLNRSPITSTIKVRVRGMDVPHSHSDGFDYEPASRSVVFFGSTYRPALGDQVVISYRVWEGSLG